MPKSLFERVLFVRLDAPEGLVKPNEFAEDFGSVLFRDDEDVWVQAVPWNLDIRQLPAHPCDFETLSNLIGSPAPGLLTPRSKSRSRSPQRVRDRVQRSRGFESGATEPAVSHAADRVANAILLATGSPSDVRTLNAWGQQVGVSRGALRVWCKAAGVSARSCLDFLRVLRAVIVSEHRPWDLLNILDVVDQRSLAQLLDRGGIRKLCEKRRPTVSEFLTRERYLENGQLRQAIARRLEAS
jgi:hypothetical protein